MKRLTICSALLATASLWSAGAASNDTAFSGEVFTGAVDDRAAFSAYGNITLPLQQQVGLHVEALADTLDIDDQRSTNIGAHLYWHDADRGLLGLVGYHTLWDSDLLDLRLDGIGVEAEVYLAPFALAAQYARTSSDFAAFDEQDQYVIEAHWAVSDAVYLLGGLDSFASEDTGYAELSFTPDSGNSPFTVYAGLSWGDYESRYLGAEYLLRSTARSNLSLFVEVGSDEFDSDAVFLGLSYTNGPVEDAPILSLLDKLRGG